LPSATGPRTSPGSSYAGPETSSVPGAPAGQLAARHQTSKPPRAGFLRLAATYAPRKTNPLPLDEAPYGEVCTSYQQLSILNSSAAIHNLLSMWVPQAPRASRDEHWQGVVSLAGMTAETRTVELGGWDGPWDADDPDANFKADVALYSHVDPMATIGRLAAAMKIPEGAVVHYVLATWASAGPPALGGNRARRRGSYRRDPFGGVQPAPPDVGLAPPPPGRRRAGFRVLRVLLTTRDPNQRNVPRSPPCPYEGDKVGPRRERTWVARIPVRCPALVKNGPPGFTSAPRPADLRLVATTCPTRGRPRAS
jgi:hypothetical protein